MLTTACTTAAPPRPGAQRGSVLILMPVAVLVFVVLGAICVDVGIVFLAERELSNAAAAAANDAAGRAIDLDTYFGPETGTLVLDPLEARAVADRSVAAKGLDHLTVTATEVVVDGPRVVVTVSADVPLVFSPAVPGGPTVATASATAEAEARGG